MIKNQTSKNLKHLGTKKNGNDLVIEILNIVSVDLDSSNDV